MSHALYKQLLSAEMASGKVDGAVDAHGAIIMIIRYSCTSPAPDKRWWSTGEVEQRVPPGGRLPLINKKKCNLPQRLGTLRKKLEMDILF